MLFRSFADGKVAAKQGATPRRLRAAAERGLGVGRNLLAAINRYEKSAAADFAPAFINLARLYEPGDIVMRAGISRAEKSYRRDELWSTNAALPAWPQDLGGPAPA